jgi:DnaJ-domain-containing protein 1
VPEEFDVSGDYGMDAGAEKCRDAAAAAGEAGSDLYAVLGLKKECSDAELKVAYRKLAMRWHPDKCSSSSSVKHLQEAKEKFQEIQIAYSGLNLPSLSTSPPALFHIGKPPLLHLLQ